MHHAKCVETANMIVPYSHNNSLTATRKPSFHAKLSDVLIKTDGTDQNGDLRGRPSCSVSTNLRVRKKPSALLDVCLKNLNIT